jgi:NAD(P)-dependent dehydrogenase (short-subunit alcohol dehydrogenase family)
MTGTAEQSQDRITRSLDQKVVVVTGGAKNLGGLISRDLAAHAASVAVHYHGSETGSAAEATVAAAIDAGAEAFALQADLTKPAAVRRGFDETVGRFGSLYAIVNTAGMVVGKPLADISEAEYDAMMGINAKAAFFVMQEAARRMEDGGRILNVLTSLLAAYTPLYSLYAGSKAPVEHFTRALSKELLARPFDLGQLDRARSDGHAVLLERRPSRRGGFCEEPGDARTAHAASGHRSLGSFPADRRMVA